MFEIYVKAHFSAAHCLRGYPGDCAHIHGHNWLVEVFVECADLDEIGIGIDFRRVKDAVRGALEALDHRHLNELPAFRHVNPTSENVAKFLYGALGEKLNSEGVRIARVAVSETPDCGASYREA